MSNPQYSNMYMPGSSSYLGDTINPIQLLWYKMLFGLTTSIKGVVGIKECTNTTSGLWDFGLTSLLLPKPFSSGCFRTMISFTLRSQEHRRRNCNPLVMELLLALTLEALNELDTLLPNSLQRGLSTAVSEDNCADHYCLWILRINLCVQ